MKTNIYKLSLLGLLSVTCGLTVLAQTQNDPTNVAETKVQAKAPGIQANNAISLAGKWRFEMDRKDVGKSDGWFKRELASTIQLPGSMAENQIGNPETGWRPDLMVWHPRFKFDYRGAAWYQTTVTIPEEWQGKITELFLERVCWQSELWVDDVAMGSCNSLTAPHTYEIGVLKPGAHRITLRLDNSCLFYLGPNTHSYHEQSCTIFNGIIGRIELNARPAVFVRSCQVYPEATTGKCIVNPVF